MKSTYLRSAMTCTALAVGVLSGATAHADARRAGLAGSLLIEDRDDIYFFPQRLAEHANLIELTYGGTAVTGSGLLTLGADASVFGVAIHRGDVQSPHVVSDAAALSGPSSLFGAPFTVAPATVVDLLWASRLGAGELGLRFALGHGQQSTTTSDLDTGESDTLIMGEVGYGWGERGSTPRLDLSGALALDLAAQEAADTGTASGTYFGFSALLRALLPIDGTLDLGLLGSAGIARNALANETVPGDPAQTELGFDLGGGIGPALSFGRVSVAGYAVVQLRIANQDPDSEVDSNDTTAHSIVIPGVHMAVEVPLSDWFFVRTGAQYSFNLRGSSRPAHAGTSQHDGSFGWNAGLGVVIDQFRFDGSLQQGFVTGGPEFIGGTSGGFLALATLSYSFDPLRHAQPGYVEPHFPPAPPPPSSPPPEAPAEPVRAPDLPANPG